MRGFAAALLMWPAALPAQTAESLMAGHDRMTRSPECVGARADEVVVCARRDDDEFRVPLGVRTVPAERSDALSMDAHMAIASASPGSRDQCGIFSDQRRCSKADMVASGWGGGRDPITAMGRLVGIIDEAPPPELPAGASGPR